MDIEALLRWAYRDELPKDAAVSVIRAIGFTSAWGGIERYGELMTLIDAPANRWGVVPIGGEPGAPHPDAVVIGEAVRALDDFELGLPEGWNPLGDLVALGLGEEGDNLLAATVGRAVDRATVLQADGRTRVLRSQLSALIRTCAILGRPPVWEADAPEVVTVKGANGRVRWFRRETRADADGRSYEVELDGFDQKRQRPHPDAYQKHVLDPDPFEAAVGRAEYEVWHAALGVLVAELDGRLVDHVACGPARAIRPWETGEAEPARILPDLEGARIFKKTLAAQGTSRGSRKKFG
ncbi:hypothetical protein [Salinarimonas sp.]|uniref:hypothetical protein n=1 Tax=Salinarimonas sp. TaxID=2766526 RepID=UPI0039187B8E